MTWRFVFGEHIINSQAEISDNSGWAKLLFVNKNDDLCQSGLAFIIDESR